jgi:DNA-binding transcriptional LysR family regulator
LFDHVHGFLQVSIEGIRGAGDTHSVFAALVEEKYPQRRIIADNLSAIDGVEVGGVQQFLAFAQTARRGSFAEAARDLGSSPSTVAKSVARLEAQLGVKLFHRTTRRVSLTGDGERLYRRCERILAEVEDLQAEAAGARATPSGTLRIDLPITYGRRIVIPLLAGLVRQHPSLTLDVRLQDSYADLVRDGLDLAIRVGPLQDSTLVARRIDWQQLVIVASPDYLSGHGTPRRIEDLTRHSAIVFRLPTSGRNRPWQLRQGRRQVDLQPEPRVSVNDGEGMVAAAVMGLGLAQIPDYMASAELEAGLLMEVMSSDRPVPMPISAVTASSRLMPPRVKLALEALEALRQRTT